MQNAHNLRQVIGKKKKKRKAQATPVNPFWQNINQVINCLPVPLLPTPRPQLLTPVRQAPPQTVYRPKNIPQLFPNATELSKNLNTQGTIFQPPNAKNTTVTVEDIINDKSANNTQSFEADKLIFNIEESKPIDILNKPRSSCNLPKNVLNNKQRKWLKYKNAMQRKGFLKIKPPKSQPKQTTQEYMQSESSEKIIHTETSMQNAEEEIPPGQNHEVIQGVASKIQLFMQKSVKGMSVIQSTGLNTSNINEDNAKSVPKQGSFIQPIDFNQLAPKPQQTKQRAQSDQQYLEQQQILAQQKSLAHQQIMAHQHSLLHQQNREHKQPSTSLDPWRTRDLPHCDYPKGIPRSFLQPTASKIEVTNPITPTSTGHEPNWVPRESSPQPTSNSLPYDEYVPSFDYQMFPQNVEEVTQNPIPYSPSDIYGDSTFANDDEVPEDAESPDLLEPGQKRLSAFQRLGPLTQPKKPKLTINLLCNKEQSIREVVDNTEDPEHSKYTPVHLRDYILNSTDPTVMKYIALWPWKDKVFLKKNVTTRKSKSVMMLEQEQMEEVYAKANLYTQVSVAGYPPSWTKEDVLDAVLDSVRGKSFIPCFIEFTDVECKFLILRCPQALTAIHKYGFSIRKDDIELIVTISQTKIYLQKLDFVPKFALRKQIALGYDGESKLSLKEFTLKKDVSHFIYFPLSRITNQTQIVELTSTVEWNCITELNLSHNRITSINGLSLPTTTPKLKYLDLSNNLMERMTMLLTCRELSLQSICLEGNPLCTDYTDPDHYIKVVRMMFPSVQEIDGIPIRQKDKYLKSKKNFCPEEVKVIIEKFLEVYFPLLDSSHDNRLLIQDMYKEDACMTVTYNIKLRYSTVFRHFRNLFLRTRVMEEGDTESIDGAVAITKLITKWPAFEHDRFTITIDVLFHTETVAIFRVGGILKLTSEFLADDEHLLAFTRTFVLKTTDGVEYKIQNEMVYWDKPSVEYSNTAFKITAIRPKNLSLKLETTPDDDLKEKLLVIFMKLTDMERKPSERCLEMKSWHLKHALECFSKLLKLDSLQSLY